MQAEQILNIIKSGETSTIQFKSNFDNQDKIVAEIIAFANAKGGTLLFGIEDKKGSIIGLSYEELQKINNRTATIANDLVKPQIYLTTEALKIEGKNILLVSIQEGVSKPYKDNNGTIWVKQGSDKRKLTDNAEILRLFQQSNTLFFDEEPIPQTSEKDINKDKVREYVSKIQNVLLDEEVELSDTLLNNLYILKDNMLTLAGLLCFSKNPQKYKPTFCIKAISFVGNSIGGTEYRDSRNILGTAIDLFDGGMKFFQMNLRRLQAGQNFNSIGKLEISEIVLEELLQNAIMHRDYTINASTRLMIFDDRVEIVSPGRLPNSLTVEKIKLGNAVVRNNLLTSFCSKIMKYRGFGSGVVRVLNIQPNIEFINDYEGEQFIVI